MMMLAVTLIVGIIHPNFFSGTNMINLFKTCPSATSLRWAFPAA